MWSTPEERTRLSGLKVLTGGVGGGGEKGATAGVTLNHAGCFGCDHQTTFPMAPLPGEERPHAPVLHQNPPPAPEVSLLVPAGQASSASSPDEDRRRGRPGILAHDGGSVLVSGEAAVVASEPPPPPEEEDCGRERLKRHRVAMAGQVWIPEIWGEGKLLKDWIDCAAIDRALVPSGLLSAREALVEECRRANSGRFRFENRCLSA